MKINPYEYIMRQMRRDFKAIHGENVQFKWKMSKATFYAFWREIQSSTEAPPRPYPDLENVTFEGWHIDIVEDGWIGIEILKIEK